MMRPTSEAVLGLIPALGVSKWVPQKNVREVDGPHWSDTQPNRLSQPLSPPRVTTRLPRPHALTGRGFRSFVRIT